MDKVKEHSEREEREEACCQNCAEKGNTNSSKSRKQIIRLIIGALVFIAAFFTANIDGITTFPVQPAVFLLSYLILGWKVIVKAIQGVFKGKVFDENFLMTIATAGALAIGEYPEAVAVMLFYLIGDYFQDLAVAKSKKSISELMDIRPDFARVKIQGGLKEVDPVSVDIGDVIVVKPGEKIPLDGEVLDGESMLDTKALTGESVPRSAMPGDTVLSGCINQSGLLTINVTKKFGESTVAKIIDLVENAKNRKATSENFITKFSKYYTPAVVGLALALAVIPPLFFNQQWPDWIHRALVFLVISCPCALVISVPLSFFGGIGCASKNGILIKGGNYLEALNNLDIVVFDKTGTLTKGTFAVTSLHPAEGYSDMQLLEYAAYAEAFSNHPIAASIREAYDRDFGENGLADYKEIPGQGVSVSVGGAQVLAGNGLLMTNSGIMFVENQTPGTKVYVSVDGKFIGSIVIADEIKPDAGAAVKTLKSFGVSRTVMLTGDESQIAQSVAGQLGIDEVHSQLLPQQKVEAVDKLLAEKQPKGKLAFVGDGINDAPVLACADIGIAMGALGSDAAIEAADVVLMTDEPSKLVTAIGIAKKTRRIVVQNIVFALGVKSLFLTLGALGISGMWEAVFADVGVSLLAVLNALRVMRYRRR